MKDLLYLRKSLEQEFTNSDVLNRCESWQTQIQNAEKFNELLDYIESRLAELKEEKEELKEFQEKDKERRCMEYALYQRELEEVAEALVEIEEDRKMEMHGANVWRQ